MQILLVSFNNGGGGPYGVGEYGYDSGLTSTEYNMAIIIGLCQSWDMKILSVSSTSSVYHLTCSTSSSTGWVHKSLNKTPVNGKHSNLDWNWLWLCTISPLATNIPAWSSTLEFRLTPCLCVFPTSVRPSSRYTRTSVSSVLQLWLNGGKFLRTSDADGTFPMHVERLMENMWPAGVLAIVEACASPTKASLPSF